MKNGLLVWNVILTVVVAYLLFTTFGKRSNLGSAADKKVSYDTAAARFRIAYFEMDSVENNLDMVKAVKAEIAKKDDEYNSAVSKLDMTYRKEYDKHMQNVKTQGDLEAAQNDLKAISDRLKNEKQDLDQEYQDFVMRRNLSVKKKIEDFLAAYNKDKNYSYIVSYEQGLFYYKDTAYNITNDLIRGMNEKYKDDKSWQ